MDRMVPGTLCCAFTGHRPEKLRFYPGADPSRGYELLFAELDRAVGIAVANGFDHFITGMCRGLDLWGAQTVLRYKQTNPHIILEAAIPHPGQESGWDEEEQALFQQIYAACDVKTVLADHYFNGCMQQRNRYMIDHASLVFACYDPEVGGGTGYTVKYAMRKKKAVSNLLETVNAKLAAEYGGQG